MIALVALSILCASNLNAAEFIVEVRAGDHLRRDSVVSVVLPAELRDAKSLDFFDLSTNKPVIAQLRKTPEPALIWIVDPPITAGASRRYKLARAESVPGAKDVVINPTSSAIIGDSAKFVQTAAGVNLLIDGKLAMTYHNELVHPPQGIEPFYERSGFIHPLVTPSGAIVTDDFPPDHAHQHGLFFAWVNTTFQGKPVDFWNQHNHTGNVAQSPVHPIPTITNGPVFATLTTQLIHEALKAQAGRTTVLNETWTLTGYKIPGLVVFDFESRQTCAGNEPLKLNKYLYGGIGMRGNRAWYDDKSKGSDPPAPERSGHSDFTTSEGKHRADGNHTRPRWVDLHGDVNGKPAGVAVLDHPSNFRSPQPVRLHPNKPYFSVAPEVIGDFTIAPGQVYTSRYRIVVHDGLPDSAQLDRLWNDYANPAQVAVLPAAP